ncbi:FadR/GntR family transcriptional regulator [Nocardia sp. NPDC006044]|uniref:FadR/GntR family transcriptional regulator n=1 Tax=Nocardia sp. NPDC006044 TaxID=3364306 RepID=UPI0036B2D31C
MSQQVADELLDRVVAGEWPVGAKIPSEPELVSALGVSRSTVREAVRSLVQARMLEPRRGDGTYVRSASPLEYPLLDRLARASARDVLEMRVMLEQRTVRLAAARASDADVDRLRAQLRLLELAALHTDTVEQFLPAALAFYSALNEASRNPLLAELYRYLMTAPIPGVAIDTSWNPDHAADLLTRLRDMVDAIAAHDPDRAEHAARAAGTAWLPRIPTAEQPLV